MKRIVTEGYHNPIVLNLSEIKDLIKELPYSEHRFVVFSENEELDEESRYQVEARVYHSPDAFTHYRTFVETADEAFAPFEAFYNNTAYSYDSWEDVTEEFC